MQNKIKQIRTEAKKERNQDLATATEMILGEISRCESKILSDDEVYDIVEK